MDMMRFNEFHLRLYKADSTQGGLALLDEFYSLWREAEECGVDAATLREEASDCLRRIAASDLVVQAICEWIGKKAHIKLSKSLAHEISVHYLQHTTLLRFALSGITEQHVTSAARRLCALDVPVVVTLGWALSMNEDLPPSHLVSSTTIKVIDFLATEHPSTCQLLLEGESSPFTGSQLAQNLAERLATDTRELEALPHLVELQMSSEMRRSFRYLRRNENRAVTEQARGKSLFDMFMTAEHFKYSNNVAIEFQNDQETVEAMVPMFTHEMSLELPQTWTADPLLYGHMLSSLWKDDNQ